VGKDLLIGFLVCLLSRVEREFWRGKRSVQKNVKSVLFRSLPAVDN
jgi:hypothetical protein